MKKKTLLGLVALTMLATLTTLGTAMAGNSGKDQGNGWVNYGNIKVVWTWSPADGKYHYVWLMDRDRDGSYCEGPVEVDYGRYYDYMIAAGYPDADNDGLIERSESCDYDADEHWGLVDDVKKEWTDKVVHLTETWVPGVTVPGGENRFVVSDTDRDGIYEGGFSTVLFWDGMTLQGDPPGPFLIMNKFEYHFDMNDDGNGYYMQYQYMHIPETEE